MTGSNTFWSFVTALTLAFGVGFVAAQLSRTSTTIATSAHAEDAQTPAAVVTPAVVPPTDAKTWIVAAPGRVEPRTGETKLGAPILGRIAVVPVQEGDAVSKGDLLIRLDDEEIAARSDSVEAEVDARRRDRDDVDAASRDAKAIRDAEDAVAKAERRFWKARAGLDNLTAQLNSAAANTGAIKTARDEKAASESKLEAEKSALAELKAASDAPAPTRIESALAAARAERSALEVQREKTRIRAPFAGTVLRLDARTGEIVAPTPEQVLVVFGDSAHLRVRAEVDEHAVGKLKLGQQAAIHSDAYPDHDFPGKVSSIAPALSAARLGSRGVMKRTDVDILEVFIDIADASPLLPGMRVDVLVKQ